jgi:hypothetical protein
MASKVTAAEKQEAIETLLSILKPGDTIYCNLAHVSKSGMMRVINFYVPLVDDDGKPWIRRIDWLMCKAAGLRYNRRHEGVEMGGCGMDMGFAAVYGLGYALWPNGTPEPHGRRNGEPDGDGGYALKHSWM